MNGTLALMESHRKSGFTIIELLVAFSIIAILIAVLLPVIAHVRASAEKVTCSSQLRQIGLVLEVYAQENKDVYPVAKYMPDPILSLSSDPGLPDVLTDYLRIGSKDAEIYKCPDDDIVYDLADISYDYNFILSGKTTAEILDARHVRRMNIQASQLAVCKDFDNANVDLMDGSTIDIPMRHLQRNVLFADGHVGRLDL